MIITSLEKINTLGLPFNVRIVDAHISSTGDMFYEYEFDIYVIADKVFSHNLSHIDIEAYDVVPRGVLSPSLLSKRDINFNIGNTRMLSSIGSSIETNRSNLQGALTKKEIELEVKQHGNRKIINTDIIGQGKAVAGNFVELGSKNVAIKNAILNFGEAIAAGPSRKIQIKPIATDSISIFSTIDSKFRDTVRASSAGLPAKQKIKIKRKRRGSRSPSVEDPLNTNVNTSYILDSFELRMKRVSGKVVKAGNNKPLLTTVINYRTKTVTVPAVTSRNVDYTSSPGQRVLPQSVAESSSNIGAFPKIKNVLPEGVSGPDTQTGNTLFTKSFKEACMRAVYEYGIPPTSLYAVSTESTIVSPMQNYQGTSKIRSNGY